MPLKGTLRGFSNIYELKSLLGDSAEAFKILYPLHSSLLLISPSDSLPSETLYVFFSNKDINNAIDQIDEINNEIENNIKTDKKRPIFQTYYDETKKQVAIKTNLYTGKDGRFYINTKEYREYPVSIMRTFGQKITNLFNPKKTDETTDKTKNISTGGKRKTNRKKYQKYQKNKHTKKQKKSRKTHKKRRN
jgi:hypothetical protein